MFVCLFQENNAMSLELDYRNKLHEVVREVKKRLVSSYHEWSSHLFDFVPVIQVKKVCQFNKFSGYDSHSYECY